MAYHFNRRIEIIKEEEGGYLPDMNEIVTVAKPWADVKTMQGRDFAAAGLSGVYGFVRFIIRYREGIKSNYKVLYDGKEYKIESIENDNGLNRTITLFCKTTEN